MNQRTIALLLMSCLLLCGCTDNDVSSNSSSSAAVATTSASAADSNSLPGSTNDITAKTTRITADAKAYIDGMLTFGYEGKEYTLPVNSDQFVNTNPHLTDIEINEKIINNRFNIPVKADITISQDMTEIIKCDVETVNGARYVQDEIQTVYHMYPYKGSVYRIASDENTFYVDLNSFKNIQKAVLPEDTEVGFDGVILDNDKLITNQLFAVTERKTEAEEDGQSGISHIGIGNTLKYHYLGIVKSMTDDTATVKLNYTGKEITVPKFFTNGEIKEGAEVAVTLNDTPTELAASNSHERDYAVFFTDVGSLVPKGAEFTDLAYFKARPGSYDPPYVFTMTNDVDSDLQQKQLSMK